MGPVRSLILCFIASLTVAIPVIHHTAQENERIRVRKSICSENSQGKAQSPAAIERRLSSNLHDAPRQLSGERFFSRDFFFGHKLYTFDHWDENHLQWNLTNVPEGFTHEEIEASIAVSLNRITNDADIHVRQADFNSATKADLQLSFVSGDHNDGYSFDGNGGILAHAFFPKTTHQGQLHFDSDETWTLDPDDHEAIQLQQVVTHEAGHTFGLVHNRFRDSIMYPYFQSTSTLSRRDMMNMQDLYGVDQAVEMPPRKEWDAPTIANRSVASFPRWRPYCLNEITAVAFLVDVVEDGYYQYLFDHEAFIIADPSDHYNALEGYPKLIRDVWSDIHTNISAVMPDYAEQRFYIFFIDGTFISYSLKSRAIVQRKESVLEDLGVRGVVTAAFMSPHNMLYYLYTDEGKIYYKRNLRSSQRLSPAVDVGALHTDRDHLVGEVTSVYNEGSYIYILTDQGYLYLYDTANGQTMPEFNELTYCSKGFDMNIENFPEGELESASKETSPTTIITTESNQATTEEPRPKRLTITRVILVCSIGLFMLIVLFIVVAVVIYMT